MKCCYDDRNERGEKPHRKRRAAAGCGPARGSADTWTDAGNFNESWFATYSGSEYLIYDAESLAAFSEKVSKNSSKDDFSGKTIRLMNDIDLSGHNWTAIGTSGYSFNGTFDGQYHTITNLTYPTEYDKGLFGYTNGATIQNVTVSTLVASIDRLDTTSQSAGGLVGRAIDTRIENSTVSGGQITSIQAYSTCGGISGILDGTSTVKNCTASDITITTNNLSMQYAGGFVGEVKSGASVTQCSANNVSVTSDLGGMAIGCFVGCDRGTISNCSATGTISGKANYVGGFAGQGHHHDSKITDCYSNAVMNVEAVAEAKGVGGFVGYSRGATYENCYATGKVSVTGDAITNVGGFLGYARHCNYGGCSGEKTTINHSITLVESITVGQAESNVSRFVGYLDAGNLSVDTNYGWNRLGYTDDAAITGLSYNGTGVSSETFWGKQDFFSTTLGWNFATIWVMNTGNPNYQLPVLSWQKRPVAGDSSSLEPPVPPQPEPQPVISSSDGNMNNAYRVLFLDGASTITVITDLSAGDRVAKPADPVKDGFTFAGWYKDEACTQEWDFTEGIPGDMSLHAKWTASGSSQTTATAEPTAKATAEQTAEPTKAPATTAPTAVTTTAAGVSPTLTQAPAPILGALLGLLAAGVLIRRRE